MVIPIWGGNGDRNSVPMAALSILAFDVLYKRIGLEIETRADSGRCNLLHLLPVDWLGE